MSSSALDILPTARRSTAMPKSASGDGIADPPDPPSTAHELMRHNTRKSDSLANPADSRNGRFG
eukprot:CAMPEP_0119425926 /NCGR_PEP_ID=MMETSP1335-20130426/35335_1 /TAXON_ID=259385 /ORGANISM="Chrysoculter rhomboideus, Strain RCC1486" /LENGTH=63 /DNA_ID=CAMNT_0007451505 /DNA_START=92 /DNA_END=283 /DNA_ORIENTATION=+